MSRLPWEYSPNSYLEGLGGRQPSVRGALGQTALSRDDGDEKQAPPLPPMQHGKVDFEALYAMGGIVIDAVPETHRRNYRYWRGGSLAKIATNFARGNQTMNTGQDLVAHLTKKRPTAVAWARYNTTSNDSRQFRVAERVELATFTGRDQVEPLPGIVFALDERFNDIDLPRTWMAMGGVDDDDDGGVIYDGALTTAMIDPHSRAIIESLQLV